LAYTFTNGLTLVSSQVTAISVVAAVWTHFNRRHLGVHRFEY